MRLHSWASRPQRRPVGQFRHYKLRRYLSCLVLASECWPQRFSGSAAVRDRARVVGSEWRGHLAWVASEVVAYFLFFLICVRVFSHFDYTHCIKVLKRCSFSIFRSWSHIAVAFVFFVKILYWVIFLPASFTCSFRILRFFLYFILQIPT